VSASKEIERRFAALLFRRVGDSLLATPALRALKAHYPNSHVIVVAEPHVARVFEGLPFIDEVRVVQRSASVVKLSKVLRDVRPSDVLDFLSDPRSAMACLLSGAKRRVGFARFPRDIAYTHKVPRQIKETPFYSAIHKLGLATALGGNSGDVTTTFVTTSGDQDAAIALLRNRGLHGKQFVAFFVTSRRQYKRWPLENFSQLAAVVTRDFGMDVAVVSGEGEREMSLEFAALAGLTERNVLCFTDLGHFAAALASASLYIGNDGGPKHLAVAVGTPTLTVFQNDPWEYWTPPNDIHHSVIVSSTGVPSVSVALERLRAMHNVVQSA